MTRTTVNPRQAGRRKGVPAGRQKTRSQHSHILTDLDDPAQNERALASQLKSMGLYAANTIGDGNCLFRALSDQLYGTPKEHANLRKEICDYLLSQPARYEAFVDDDRPFVDHVRVMRENGTYGGHLELTAFAHLKRKWIKVVQPGLVYIVSCEDESPSKKGKAKAVENVDDDENKTVYLAYHSWEHWSSVRNLDGPHFGPCRIQEIHAEAQMIHSSPEMEMDVLPTREEQLVITSIPPNLVSLHTIRTLLEQESGEWERVVEIIISRHVIEEAEDSSLLAVEQLVGLHEEPLPAFSNPISRLKLGNDYRSGSPASSEDTRLSTTPPESFLTDSLSHPATTSDNTSVDSPLSSPGPSTPDDSTSPSSPPSPGKRTRKPSAKKLAASETVKQSGKVKRQERKLRQSARRRGEPEGIVTRGKAGRLIETGIKVGFKQLYI